MPWEIPAWVGETGNRRNLCRGLGRVTQYETVAPETDVVSGPLGMCNLPYTATGSSFNDPVVAFVLPDPRPTAYLPLANNPFHPPARAQNPAQCSSAGR